MSMNWEASSAGAENGEEGTVLKKLVATNPSA